MAVPQVESMMLVFGLEVLRAALHPNDEGALLGAANHSLKKYVLRRECWVHCGKKGPRRGPDSSEREVSPSTSNPSRLRHRKRMSPTTIIGRHDFAVVVR